MERSDVTIIISWAVMFALLSSLIFAAPNQITLQGKLTDSSGSAQASTTINFTFSIYDSFTDGTALWEMANENITTDANGVYDVILRNINLTFADQYYLGITVSTDNESKPRINLTSSPYSFRANTSEDLNQNNSFIIRNLSVTGNTTIGIGALSTLKIKTLNLNLTLANLNFSGGLGISGLSSYFLNNLGIGKIIPTSRLDVVGDVSISGPLNASSINITGNAYFAINSGNVGIGNINPNATLDVSGNIKLNTANPIINISGPLIKKSGDDIIISD